MKASFGGVPVMGRSLWSLARLCPDARARVQLFVAYARLLLVGRRGAVRHSKPERVRLLLNGSTRDWWVGDAGELAALWQVFVAEEYDGFLPPDASLVIDAGANVGSATAWFRIRYPGARVIAVEADPLVVERLRRNVGADPMVEVVHAALSDTDGKVSFVPGRWSVVGRLKHPGDSTPGSTHAGAEAVEVESVTLDALSRRVGRGARIDFLKLDVEGSEWRVLSGGLGQVDAAVLEVHEPTPDGRPADTLLGEIAAREGFSLRRGAPSRIRWLLRR